MSDVPSADRAEHYRRMAEATRELARHTADPEIRANYLDLAERWRRLADRASLERLGPARAPIPETSP